VAGERDIGARMAVAEQRLDILQDESQRTRERLHSLESDRATIRLLTRQVSDLVENCEKLADRAAATAVDAALEAYEERKKNDRRTGLDLRAKWTSIGIAACGLVFGLLELLR
jgi:chromosome segregation ATPase